MARLQLDEPAAMAEVLQDLTKEEPSKIDRALRTWRIKFRSKYGTSD